MINWKVVVGSGAVAVVLSLLTGIISGVSFGTLMLRAVMWGALFCGAGAGISFVVSKYLPELQSLPKKPESQADEARNVDIVLPGENPHAGSEEDSQSYGLFDGADVPSPTTEGESGDAEDENPREDSNGATMVEEVEETHRDRVGSSGAGSTEVESAEELPDLDDEEEGGTSGSQSGFQPQGLSDITSVSGRGSTIDVMGHEADTEEIARAIRTALKKDQKG